MHDGSISTSKLIAASLWAISAAVLGAAWIAWGQGEPGLAIMMASSSVLPAAAAGVAQVKCYSLRLCGLLRVVADDQDEMPPLRSLR